MAKKSQSALEYLLIIALTLGLIIPTSYLFFKFSTKSNDEIIDAQVTQIGNALVETAETVFFSGEGSKIVLDVNIPKNVIDVKILSSRELVFKMLSEAGERELVFFSAENVPIISDDASPECDSQGDCGLSSLADEGLKKIKVEAILDNGEIKARIMEIN